MVTVPRMQEQGSTSPKLLLRIVCHLATPYLYWQEIGILLVLRKIVFALVAMLGRGIETAKKRNLFAKHCYDHFSSTNSNKTVSRIFIQSQPPGSTAYTRITTPQHNWITITTAQHFNTIRGFQSTVLFHLVGQTVPSQGRRVLLPTPLPITNQSKQKRFKTTTGDTVSRLNSTISFSTIQTHTTPSGDC